MISNAQSGALPDGWVEYFDKASGRTYYYNVHTKTTTWYKPRKDKPPPPPPPGAVGGRASKGDAEMDDAGPAEENSTSAGHGVADAIAAMQTRKAMVEQVRARPKPPTCCCWVTQIDGPRRVRLPADALVRALPASQVQIECSIAPRNGPQGLQSVSL